MLTSFSHIPGRTIKLLAANPDKADFKELIRYIATYLGQCLTSRQLEIRPILYHTIVDGMTHKERVIGVE